MTSRKEAALLLLLGSAVAYALSRVKQAKGAVSNTTIGELEPITGPGSGDAASLPPVNISDGGPGGGSIDYGLPDPSAVAALCARSPRNSFGPACENVTWVVRNGYRVDLREFN